MATFYHPTTEGMGISVGHSIIIFTLICNNTRKYILNQCKSVVSRIFIRDSIAAFIALALWYDSIVNRNVNNKNNGQNSRF